METHCSVDTQMESSGFGVLVVIREKTWIDSLIFFLFSNFSIGSFCVGVLILNFFFSISRTTHKAYDGWSIGWFSFSCFVFTLAPHRKSQNELKIAKKSENIIPYLLPTWKALANSSFWRRASVSIQWEWKDVLASYTKHLWTIKAFSSSD